MPFAPIVFEDLQPVQDGEVVCPTRVVWRGVNGLLTSRVLPTVARAYLFAAERPGAIVQAIDEAPPKNENMQKRRIRQKTFAVCGKKSAAI